jgi:glycosyltransferase involved in cell wall biosynthesis
VPPKVSVIIPIYNAERYLAECLDSLLCQTLQEIEIICADDASTDRSRDILADYAVRDPRVKLVLSEVNGRQGTARNLGLYEATAPYIGFVDADDFVSAEYFEHLYGAIIKHDADIVITLYQHIDEHGEDLQLKKQSFIKSLFHPNRHLSSNDHDWDAVMGKDWECNKDFSDKLQRLATVNHSMLMNRLYRKSLVDQVKFQEKIRFEDTPFIVEVTQRAARIFTTPEGGYFYRRHTSSTTSSLDFQKFIEAFTAHKALESYIELAVMDDEEREAYRKMLTGNYRYYVKELARELPWLTLTQLKQVRKTLPVYMYLYLLKQLSRKHLKLAIQAGTVLLFLVGLFIWVRRPA